MNYELFINTNGVATLYDGNGRYWPNMLEHWPEPVYSDEKLIELLEEYVKNPDIEYTNELGWFRVTSK